MSRDKSYQKQCWIRGETTTILDQNHDHLPVIYKGSWFPLDERDYGRNSKFTKVMQTRQLLTKIYCDLSREKDLRVTACRWIKIALFTSIRKLTLTRLRLRSLIKPAVTFQMVGTDPGFIRLSVPFTWTARVKQSASKCSKHIPNVPVGLKFLRCWQTNLFHFTRMLPLNGEVCIEIPNCLSETRLQSYTTQAF